MLESDWSFQTLFGRTIERSCPVAQSSSVIVALPTNGLYSIRPEPPSIAAGLATYDINNSTPYNSVTVFSTDIVLV